MIETYQNIESENRYYKGFQLSESEVNSLLQDEIKKNLLDSEQRESLSEMLKTLPKDTGFEMSDSLLLDIQSLENERLSVPNWRIGEAMAEVVLEKEFSCRFHWNELRDARNPQGNKTGADIVGFIELEGQILFLFGEVKTSSETNNRPPQVMTKSDGIENQLKELYEKREKRLILISYLQSKANILPDGHQFKIDFSEALRNYYKKYQLIGILIRDVISDEDDLRKSYDRLKTQILNPQGLRLLALYTPVSKERWLRIINESH